MFHDCDVLLYYDALHRQLIVIATANHGNNKKRNKKKQRKNIGQNKDEKDTHKKSSREKRN